MPILIINERVIDTTSMGATIIGTSKDLGESNGFAAHFIWSGSPVGSVQVEASNDGTNFIAVNTQATGGSSGQHLYNQELCRWKYVRLSYSRTSGTGTLDAYLSAKVGV